MVERLRGARDRSLDLALRRPVLAVAAVALVARLVIALASFVIHHSGMIPDETQYIGLSSTVAAGHSADSWHAGYGQALYRSTWPFSAALTLLFRIFGPTRIAGQLYVVAFGVLTAALTVVVARRVLSPRGTLLAGLIVALLPSQVLWSSVVLREALVWACLAGIGACIACAHRARSFPRAAALLAVVVVLVFALTFLRTQTAVVAGWSAVLGSMLLPGARRALAGLALAAAIVAPWTYGIGPGGIHLVADASVSIGTTRTLLGLEASTAVSREVPYEGAGHERLCPASTTSSTLPGASALSSATTIEVQQPDGSYVHTACVRGVPYVVHDTGASTLGSISDGVAASFLRPYPWEPSPSRTGRLAGFESVAWYSMYVFAIIGLVRLWRSYAVLTYPVVVGAGLMAASVLTQGNVGTAFRHRGQCLWVLAIFAAAGIDHVWSRRHPAPAENVA